MRSSGIFSIFGVVIGVSKTPGPGCNVVLKVQPFVSKQWLEAIALKQMVAPLDPFSRFQGFHSQSIPLLF